VIVHHADVANDDAATATAAAAAIDVARPEVTTAASATTSKMRMPKTMSSLEAAAHARHNSGGHRGGWRWSNDEPCDEAAITRHLTPAEAAAGRWASEARITAAVDAFRRCGVLVIPAAVAKSVTRRWRDGLDTVQAPLLASRRRVRAALSSTRGKTLEQVWTDPSLNLTSELLFRSGSVYRERNDARIDIQAPFAAPFNDKAVTHSPLVAPLMRRLLGVDVRLKQINAVTALPLRDGIGMQHWHRDTEVLFHAGGAAGGIDSAGTTTVEVEQREVHEKYTGVHLPPFAINMFVALQPLTAANGPTEFTLASHQWGARWSDDEHVPGHTLRDRIFTGPEGTVILFDYRTVHRGTVNRSKLPRSVAMLIYGRAWWSDTANYGYADSGGLQAMSSQKVRALERARGEHIDASNDDDSALKYESMTAELRWRRSHDERLRRTHMATAVADGGVVDDEHDDDDASAVIASANRHASPPGEAEKYSLFRFFARLWKPSILKQHAEKRRFDAAS
jgi:hypothetical protein